MTGKPTLVSPARARRVPPDHLQRLNAPHRVNARTLERVLPAIEESGYRPNVAGRQLRTRRSRNLAMRLFPSADGINGAILDRFLHALTEAAQRDGYRLTLFTAPTTKESSPRSTSCCRSPTSTASCSPAPTTTTPRRLAARARRTLRRLRPAVE